MITIISIFSGVALTLIFISILQLLKIRKLKIRNTIITEKFKKQRKFYYWLLSTGIVLLFMTFIINLIMNLK